MLTRADTYAKLVADFRWQIPKRYNIGTDVCDRHAGSNRLALIHLDGAGGVIHYGFRDLHRLSNRFANVLVAHGLKRGDRLGVLLPQCPEAAIVHITGFRAGLITIPLFTLFGPDALAFRLRDSATRVVVTDRIGAEKLAPLRDQLPHLEQIYSVDGLGPGTEDFHAWCARALDSFTPVDTDADAPALISYTSGTTGDPKGALHAHRALLGHLPGVEMPQRFFPQPGDRFWTPADWAWIGGLFDVLMPAWHHGVPVVSYRAKKFDPEEAFRLMAEQQVRNAFLPPTAMKLMREIRTTPYPGLSLRSVGSGGESLGAEMLAWGKAVLGIPVNEFYGQTECNLVVSSCADIFPSCPGSMGRPVPGHDVRIVDGAGQELPDDAIGHIAVRRPDPVMFLGYWNNPSATERKFAGEMLMTGDLGRRDSEGRFWFVGRDDDIITSGGYRIGPGEIEDCLLRHPAVALCGVIGVPDPVRTEAVKAFIVLKEGMAGTPDLAHAIQDFVKTRLAAHEYPRQVAFVSELPMTATGKIIRRALRQQEGSAKKNI